MEQVTRKDDKNWVEGLRDLGKEEPKELFYRGNIELLREKCVAVVGSRRITEYGRQVVKKLVTEQVAAGKVIVSGFMYGTDQAVHRETLVCGGKTVAVLGWGIDVKLVDEEKRLAKQILEAGGLLISEWREQLGALWTFPRRDRIMAAVAQQVYVTEAAMKSGSLITAEWARKLGRELWAVPGPVTSKVSAGTNWLLEQGRAQIWLPNSQRDIKVTESNSKETEIYITLQNEILSADELARKLKMEVKEVGTQLSLLELEGKVVEKGGKYYLRS